MPTAEPMTATALLLAAGLCGFLAGVVVNLLADYLPARRYHLLARRSPFASVKPAAPTFIPRRADRSPWPVPVWSGTVAALLGAPAFHPATRWRRALVECGLALAFAGLAAAHGGSPSLIFYLFYACGLILIVVTDVERRWIMAEATWALAVAALAESALVGRVAFGDALAGGALGLVILMALVVGGVAFAALARVATGRRIGRTVMGGGDGRLAAAGGLILGPGAIGPALLVAILAGGIGAAVFVALRLIRKGGYRRFSAIPYGPYLALGIALTLYAPAFTFGLLLGVIRIIRGG